MRGGILALIGVVAVAIAAVLIIWLIRVPEMYTVEGNGEVRFTPDEAEITASIYAENAVSLDAVKEAAGTMRQILAALKNIDVAQSDIKTADVRSGLLDNERQKPGEARIYYAEQAVAINVKDIKHIGKILDAVSRAGSNYWLVTYKSSKTEELSSAARAAALTNAVATADAYAREGKFRRGRVLKIQDGDVTFPSIDYAEREYRTGRAGYGSVEKVTVTGTRIKELPIETTFDIPPPKERAVKASTHVLFAID
jgi:uncharacterized protein